MDRIAALIALEYVWSKNEKNLIYPKNNSASWLLNLCKGKMPSVFIKAEAIPTMVFNILLKKNLSAYKTPIHEEWNLCWNKSLFGELVIDL